MTDREPLSPIEAAIARLLRAAWEAEQREAIGAALGVDHKTVVNDMAGGEYSPPAPAPVIGLDGKT